MWAGKNKNVASPVITEHAKHLTGQTPSFHPLTKCILLLHALENTGEKHTILWAGLLRIFRLIMAFDLQNERMLFNIELVIS